MNRENLQRMADYIRTIPQEKFDMKVYRAIDDNHEHKCKTVGCIAGHCTILDTLENLSKSLTFPDRPPSENNPIDFYHWVLRFTGVNHHEWKFLFGPKWANVDNTPEGAALRIEYLLKNDCPNEYDIYDMQHGRKPLVYRKSK